MDGVRSKCRARVTSKQNMGSLASSAAVFAFMLLPRSALRFGTSSSAHANSCTQPLRESCAQHATV